MPKANAIDSCQLVDAPAGGFFRVSDWHDPLEPPPAPAPLGEAGEPAEPSGRWDEPDGQFRTLYCASDPEGAIAEKLADFTLNHQAAVRIEAFLVDTADEEWADEQLLRTLDAEDIESFNWTLASAPAVENARFIDLEDWRTFIAARPALTSALLEAGLRRFDRATLLDDRRSVTRRIAGFWHAQACHNAPDTVRGLRYRSRLPPLWICWAVWEPLALEHSQAQTEPVTIHTPALREAARKLGVMLADDQ